MERENRITFRFLLITDRIHYPENFLEKLDIAAGSGIDAIQLREKELPGGRYYRLALTTKKITDRYHMPLIINDRVDIAVSISCDGVHLPGNSFSPRVVRTIVKPSMLIGKSSHHIDEALTAAEEGADYVVFGPVYNTPSKQKYGRPQGIDMLGEVCRACPVPVIAIGGINRTRIKPVMDAGAYGIGVISAVFDSPDIAATVSGFRETLRPYR